ncbi:FAD binding domain-containing protein [Apodospora peruviana]|uniref:FAD binding domain-containing protein n=1 Tax=Apodospora peruviana TaxID=516989 RepID=A0AAE0MFX1_9PEZI|nr:FAD binding domain-containing protein [Apodospora peruviana]
MPLQVIIVGAGIAGLSAAISLRRAGHEVHIYERSAMNNEVGAAINVPPNAIRFLTAWGIDPVASRFCKARETSFVDPVTLETTATISHERNRARYGGADLWYAHRVDLHDSLKKLATGGSGPGRAAKIYLKSVIVGYNPDTPSITLADGTIVKGDLVIGADGIHSLASETVLGRKVEPTPPAHYNCCYRFLIPAATVEADPETRFWNLDAEHPGEKPGLRIITHNETSRRMVSYPCRNHEVHNFVGIFCDPDLKSATREDYMASVDKATVLEKFAGFSPSLLAVVNKATEIKRWPLLYRPPTSTWRKGRLILAGDAAHPMLPHQGQGGAQGLEDGCVLGIVMYGSSDDPEEIKRRLELYEQIRRNRASAIQVLSNVGQDQSHLVYEELKQYMEEKDIPTNPSEILGFTFAYDVVGAAVKVMKGYDAAFEAPAAFKLEPATTASQSSDGGSDITEMDEKVGKEGDLNGFMAYVGMMRKYLGI